MDDALVLFRLQSFVLIMVSVCVLRQQALFHVLTAYSMYNTVSLQRLLFYQCL